MAEHIPDFKGAQYARGSKDYNEHRYQYGYSSHTDRVNPALVAYPVDEDDVCAAVRYGNQRGIAIALRTGGHQYSAASSTIGENIQLDLSQAFLTFEDQGNARVRVGISFGLREFNGALGKLGYFVPHGQCSHVHVGGHAQTGGYGQLGRSFGLFGDHIEEIEIVNANGEIQTIARGEGSQEDKDLFYAILGGSPGNYAVLTHLTIRVHKNSDHPYSRGLKFFCWYRKDQLKKFLDIKVRMANDPNFPRDLDYCVTVLGSTPLSLKNLGIDEAFKHEHPDVYGQNDIWGWPNNIIIYVQWANTGGAAQDENSADFKNAMKWFDEIHDVARKTQHWPKAYYTYFDGSKHRTMSRLTRDWIFTNVREFELPYEKRTYMTNSPTLVEDKWSKWCSDRIDVAMRDRDLKLSIQIQNFGGNNSLFYRNGLVGDTAYSWRDSTICCVMDCFYKSGARNKALAWQAENDKCVDPQTGVFNKGDRRVLWGSYGSYDLHETRLNYHETEEKYQRLCEIKRRVDTTGVFVANTFCVGWNLYDHPPSPSSTAAAEGVTTSDKKKPRRSLRSVVKALGGSELETTASTANGFDEQAMVENLLKRKRPVEQLADIVGAATSGSIRVTVAKAVNAVGEKLSEKKRKLQDAVSSVTGSGKKSRK